MTEFGAEARPELADDAGQREGQLRLPDLPPRTARSTWPTRAPISGAIYWTLREFEIYPGWTGGAGPRPPQFRPNTRHQKGLLTYEGVKKPAWYVARDRFMATPLYP